MKARTSFWAITTLLILILSIMTYVVLRRGDLVLFFCVEGLLLITTVYIIVFYRRVIKPLDVIGRGMELLREQDFSSRLGRVGQYEADRIVEIFNKMMEQLKNERLLLREQNHFLDLLIDASPMGVLVLDLEGRVQGLNPAFVSLVRETLSGTDTLPPAERLKGLRPEEIPSQLLTELMRVPLHESDTIRLGNAHIYKCTHSSFIDRGFSRDFYLIESLTREVFKAEKKAYEKVIRMIAHEVNNTTAGITSTLDTVETLFRSDPEMQEVCEVLHVAAERCFRMSNFITDFADVVRIPEPQPATHSLNATVLSSKRFMETLCADRNIDIRLELSPADPIVRLDPALFDQVLVNMIKNAVESIERNGTILIHTSLSPCSLEVIDNGRGIDPSVQPMLFTPFFSTKPNGQGIGLIFIREVLERHGCRFSLATEEDGRTCFRVVFD